MIIVRALIVIYFLLSSVVYSFNEELPLTVDDRIKTYVYNPNEVYLMVLHTGFQSSIEFAKNEEVQRIILGDNYSWEIIHHALPNRIFIKPLEKNMRTNMTVITNQRTYEFDIVSKELELGYEHELIYLIRFYYPQQNNKHSK